MPGLCGLTFGRTIGPNGGGYGCGRYRDLSALHEGVEAEDARRELERGRAALTGSLDSDTVVDTIFEQLKRVLDYDGAAPSA